MRVEDNFSVVKERIKQACERSGRSEDEIKVIAVTKYVSAERTQEAIDAGIIHIGENRIEGLLEKQHAINGQAVWHFIGSLQTRKVKDVVAHADYIHSLDRTSLAKEIHKRAVEPVRCFVQVNVSGEESKHGLTPEEVIPFVKELASYDRIIVVGLMTMAPFTEDEQVLRSCFRKLKELQLQVKNLELPYAPCQELSMGMSNDFEIAIEEGSTCIRVGTALVGENS
ncbi:YggS family pyridoxal phosphate-dependent enzyme [Bacillus sp. AGMB 02131]|uniref:Pyridoxal phosphate homeostasis protein n=1 Tax=Peribacillus faecalis TaxID=2772559 RepID=A0A927HAX2_9BACI|nr:YggS family pyridoxal phosphate-dependent enzyme [Peribacillus faecalis]MBD3106808.1 YggS family pyridoxal phosphate-dependent enzyme [Peribacillus faecalis]